MKEKIIQNSIQENKQKLFISQAAETLGYSKSYTRMLCNLGKLKCEILSNRYRVFDVMELIRFKENMIKSTMV